MFLETLSLIITTEILGLFIKTPTSACDAVQKLMVTLVVVEHFEHRIPPGIPPNSSSIRAIIWSYLFYLITGSRKVVDMLTQGDCKARKFEKIKIWVMLTVIKQNENHRKNVAKRTAFAGGFSQKWNIFISLQKKVMKFIVKIPNGQSIQDIHRVNEKLYKCWIVRK